MQMAGIGELALAAIGLFTRVGTMWRSNKPNRSKKILQKQLWPAIGAAILVASCGGDLAPEKRTP